MLKVQPAAPDTVQHPMFGEYRWYGVVSREAGGSVTMMAVWQTSRTASYHSQQVVLGHDFCLKTYGFYP